jgi:hypothetical protein
MSIPAETTGHFMDITHTDNITAGDLLLGKLVPGGTTKSVFLNGAGVGVDSASYIFGGAGGYDQGAEQTYAAIPGKAGLELIEEWTQLSMPKSTTLSGMRLGMFNSTDVTCTVTFRKNTANGNQTVSVPSAGSGVYQDVTHSDSIAVSDLINISFQCTGRSSGTVSLLSRQFKDADNSEILAMSEAFNSGLEVPINTTYYETVMGGIAVNSNEPTKQISALVSCTMKNLTVKVASAAGSNIDADWTVSTRKNGGDGNLTVTVPKTTTGYFSDAVNKDDLIYTDLYCLKVVTVGTTGKAQTQLIYMEQQEYIPPVQKSFSSTAQVLIGAGQI